MPRKKKPEPFKSHRTWQVWDMPIILLDAFKDMVHRRGQTVREAVTDLLQREIAPKKKD